MMTSDDEEYELYQTDAPIIKLRSKIIEPLGVYGYIPIVVNVLWIVDDYIPNGDEYEKINIAVLILDVIPELRQLRNIHFLIVESMYKLVENEKLQRLKKRNLYFIGYIVGYFKNERSCTRLGLFRRGLKRTDAHNAYY